MSEEKWLETNNGIEYKTGFDAKLWHGIITSKVDPIRQYQLGDTWIAFQNKDGYDYITIDFDQIDEYGESDLGESGMPNVLIIRKER
mgnify:CR=1 FL=1